MKMEYYDSKAETRLEAYADTVKQHDRETVDRLENLLLKKRD